MTQMIFVFGSNLDGIHGAGAARYAHEHYGAVFGVGEGRTGDAYALPTKGHGITDMKWSEIIPAVSRFILYAQQHPELNFLLTPVGCGLAGHSTLTLMRTLRKLSDRGVKLPPNVFLSSTFATDWVESN